MSQFSRATGSATRRDSFDLVLSSGTLFRAGDCPPPGLYRQTEGARRRVEIGAPGERLPASLDGQVACYRRVEMWGQIASAPSCEDEALDHAA